MGRKTFSENGRILQPVWMGKDAMMRLIGRNRAGNQEQRIIQFQDILVLFIRGKAGDSG
jgi:hypothetical protein